jgi:ribosomal protein L15
MSYTKPSEAKRLKRARVARLRRKQRSGSDNANGRGRDGQAFRENGRSKHTLSLTEAGLPSRVRQLAVEATGAETP